MTGKAKFDEKILLRSRSRTCLILTLAVLAHAVYAEQSGPVPAPDAPSAGVNQAIFTINNAWMMVATLLVFVMHLGFATVEAGLNRAKNAVNILFKNTTIPAIGLITYAVIGFGLMYPADHWWVGKLLGFAGFGIGTGPEGVTSAYNPGYTYWTDFLFQAMFAATAATIVSGAVCERIRLVSFLIFSTIYVALVYPWIGSWAWGGGWLKSLGFHDFAGSTLVHSVGGWAALVGAIMVGPRSGKYVNGTVNPIMGHNLPLVTIGAFLLWLGWFGFNGGSVLSADPGAVSYVLVTTNLAAAAGAIGSMVTSWILQTKPDLTMVLNGILAGLVGITAGADVVSVPAAILIGLVAGIFVVLSVLFWDRLRVDDPVGAVSVHLVCGIWGTLATGIFGRDQAVLPQLIGIVAVGVTCLLTSGLIFAALRMTLGLRVSREEEILGLDLHEHGMEAYPDFQSFLTK
jgi:Amt family ammonium transporter